MDTSTWDFAYSSPPSHSATEDDASSLSTPGSPTSSDQSSREDICNQYEILSSLHNLGDLDRAGVAHLEEEVQLADKRYRQQIIVLDSIELRRQRAQEKLLAASVKLQSITNVMREHNNVHSTDRKAPMASVSGAPGKLTIASSQTLIYGAHRFLVRQAGQDPRSAPATHPRGSI